MHVWMGNRVDTQSSDGVPRYELLFMFCMLWFVFHTFPSFKINLLNSQTRRVEEIPSVNTLPCVSPYISLVVHARSNITASGIAVGSLVYSVD